jgi:hypothetical protein
MQNTVIRQTGAQWAFLEPAMNPNHARTDHIKLIAAASTTYVLYPAGQVVRQKNDGTNAWAKYGTSGYGGPCRILKYPVLVNDLGQWQITGAASWNANDNIHEGSVDAYYQGFFFTNEIISAGGTNEIQTETLDAGVDGGTRTLSFQGYVTAPIAWNANAAAIKAACLLAWPSVVTADLTVAGTGPFTYTFAGAYAGANVPLIVVDPTLLTDGGVAPATTGSVIVESTPGAGLLTGVGRLVRGTAVSGIVELGAATPA